MQHLLHFIKINLARVLLGLWIRIVELESSLEDQVNLGDLSLKDVLKRLFIDVLGVGSLFGKHLVASEESFDRIDTDWDKVLPGDVSRGVLISESEENADVILSQVVSWQKLESLVELNVAQLTTISDISLREKQSQCALKCLNETR